MMTVDVCNQIEVTIINITLFTYEGSEFLKKIFM